VHDQRGDAAEAMRARKFAMLQSFMHGARQTLALVSLWRGGRSGRRGKSKSRGKATSAALRAFQLRKEQNRSTKKQAILARLAALQKQIDAERPRAPDTNSLRHEIGGHRQARARSPPPAPQPK